MTKKVIFPVDTPLYYSYNTVERCITRVIQLGVMIDFKDFTAVEGKPIYQQIIRHVKRGCISGTISDGDELPSVRALAALLGINPMTVQKAYRLLSEEGVVESRAGSKSCITVNDEIIDLFKKDLLEETVSEMVNELKQMGINLNDAQALMTRYWGCDENEEQ